MKLHLGCGKRYLKGYTHVDLADYNHIDYRCDIRKLPEHIFPDSAFDLIYASHVIEYFGRDEIGDVLKEWHRVLKIGGILRLAVPDFEALIKVYNKFSAINLIHGPLYGKWEVPGFSKQEFGENWNHIYHKTVYDYFSLRTVLWKALFKNVRRWSPYMVFIGEHEGFDDYSQSYIPHMDKENGILISLNVEAEK